MLEQVYQTENDALILASSGSGAMEAAVVNLFSPGDTVIYVNGGKFGERWGKIAARYGINAVEIRVEWGSAVDVSAVEAALKEHPDARGVLLQASETSTTTEHPVRDIARLTATRDDCAIVVDAITALGVIDMPMDDWGLDVVISGSQKALMLPPGLAFIALSDKAWRMAESSTSPKFYFDLAAERKNQQAGKDTTAWTPGVSLIIGLHEVLTMVFEEGLENLFARHALLARATRAGVEALGLKLLSSAPASSATGAYVPEGVNGGAFVKYLRDTMGVTFAGGQDHLKGRIIRIAHLGDYDVFDIVTAMSAIEIALNRFGHDVRLGAGVGAAQAVLAERFPMQG
jgi:aspartate aminotransferase-like enzyme